MKDLVLDGFVKNFADARGLTHLERDKLFESFVFSSILKKYHQSDTMEIENGGLVSGSDDGGLDAVAIMVNGRPAQTEKDVQFFVEHLRRLDVEFVFMQAKFTTSFRAADIGTFVFGVEQFFAAVTESQPKIEFSSEIQQLVQLARYIYQQGIKMQENPKCSLYYVTAGKWTGATHPSGRLSYGKEQLRKFGIFSVIHANPIDAELLKDIYREVERGVVKEIEFSKTAVFPRINGVDDAYIGLLSGDEFIKMVSTEDGELNRKIFYDNVRDFQGHNPVNGEINLTLNDERLRYTFPLLNNGITIVARDLNRRGDIFKISDFQIVNGCQTTHILFQNNQHIDKDIFVPVKLLATTNRQLIAEVIKATNRQTAVLPEALESLTPFHRELEDFYEIHESTKNIADRIHYERRSKQYAWDNINQKNIVSLTAQIKSFIGMFLNEPHSHPRYYGELLGSYEGRLFVSDHKPEPYYASGVALLIIEKWLNSRSNERRFRSYKYQLLMLLRAIISGNQIPRLNSNAISDYSLKIVKTLYDTRRRDEACEQAADLLLAGLSEFGARRGERNPPHRLRAFTNLLTQKCIPSGKWVEDPGEIDDSVSSDNIQLGKIIWFDEYKNYGFIAPDTGEDIFVHGGEIRRVPWHLRIVNQRVEFRVRPNPKSPNLSIAIDVRLETT